MSYPIIPIIHTWNTSYSNTARMNESRNQEGVHRRERLGINLISEEIEGSIVIRNYPEVDEFLRQRRGLPFRLQPENRLLDAPDRLYICREWQGQKLGPGAWRFSGKLEQVRTLRDAPT
jgi:hypothetical protein